MDVTPEHKTIRKPRRPRTIQACNFCRTKKYKCDGSLPCSNCKRLQKTCAFSSDRDLGSENISISYVKELERRLEAAEAQLRTKEQADSSTTSLHETKIRSKTQASNGSNSTRQSSTPDITPSQNVRQQQQPEPSGDRLPEIFGRNTTTHSFQYHGSTSIITLLDNLVLLRDEMIPRVPETDVAITALPISTITEFQNDAFLTTGPTASILPISFDDNETFPLYAPVFLDAYFSSMHYVHPLLDQSFFMHRCQRLWTGQMDRLRPSFRLLYYAVLALGASIRSWVNGPVNGMGRAEWTQLLMAKAEQWIFEAQKKADFEGAQAMFMLSQVCLQSLAYNNAYLFLGHAIRLAHMDGIHRWLPQEDSEMPNDSPTHVIGRLFWSLYAQEAELSLILGRPDICGHEAYIDRIIPPICPGSEVNIIPAMIGFTGLLREISSVISYGGNANAASIEEQLDAWLAQARTCIWDDSNPPATTAGTEDLFWVPLQRTMLSTKCLHAKIALHYPSFIQMCKASNNSSIDNSTQTSSAKCLDASRSLIRELFQAYKQHTFHRTWAYYSVFLQRALVVVILNLARLSIPLRQVSEDRDYIVQAIHVLDALQTTDVTRRVADFARELLSLLSMNISINPLPSRPSRYKGPPREIPHIKMGADRPPRPSSSFPMHQSVNTFQSVSQAPMYHPMSEFTQPRVYTPVFDFSQAAEVPMVMLPMREQNYHHQNWG